MASAKPLPSQERLQELFDYSVITGHLYHRQGRNRGHTAGGLSGNKGYLYAWVDGKLYRAHRLVWKWVTGDDHLHGVIDHCDRDPINNAWHNLRSATHSANLANSKVNSRNTSGYKGVSYHKASGKWMAMVWKERQHHYLGLYNTPEEAHAAYVEAAERFHGEFARVE